MSNIQPLNQVTFTDEQRASMMEAANEVLATLRAKVLDLAALQDQMQGVIMGQSYVVRVGTLYLCNRNGAPELGRLTRATCYAAKDAQRIAANVANGNDEKGQAIHIRDAVKQELAGARAMLADMEVRFPEL